MTTVRRWSLVGVGIALLLAVPFLVNARPVRDADVSATALLTRIQRSADLSWSGEATSRGGVAIPSDSGFGSVAKLLGSTTDVRVWWGGAQSWRVATVRPSGETDLYRHGGQVVRWVYESKRVTVMPVLDVRLPDDSDVVPPVLARRVLADARPDELSRIEPRRVAGRRALGLRLTPSGLVSSVGQVDVWADADTGLPLRVDVVGRGAGTPALTTAFTALTPGAPDDADLVFTPPSDSSVNFDDVVDLASAAERYADQTAPATLLGMDRRVVGTRAVGVYGRGPTVVLAVPLWHRFADDLRAALRSRPGTVTENGGDVLVAGPLTLVLADTPDREHSWLVVGTVTADAARSALSQLERTAGESTFRPGGRR